MSSTLCGEMERKTNTNTYSEHGKNYNTMQINTDIVLEFLTLEYNRGLSYNANKECSVRN